MVANALRPKLGSLQAWSEACVQGSLHVLRRIVADHHLGRAFESGGTRRGYLGASRYQGASKKAPIYCLDHDYKDS